MRIVLSFCCAIMVVATAPALAQSPFDGTWKGDVSTAKTDAKPDQLEVKDGIYTCATCLPPLTVKADGLFHAIADRPYWDEIAVRVVNGRTLRAQYRRDGRVVGETRRVVSDDGNTLTISSMNTYNAAELPINATSTASRVGPAPAGAHAISGLWQVAPDNAVSDAALTMTVKVVGDRLNLSTPTGETLDAIFGGPYALNVGNPGKMTTKAERPQPNQIRLTDMLAGRVIRVSTYTLSPDGIMLDGEWTDPRDGSKGTFVARRQP